MEALKNSVFSNIQENYKDHKWLCKRAILAPKKNSVNAINPQIQEELSGSTKPYTSVDTIVDVNESAHYPIEFLNSLEPAGMPLHNLLFKIGFPIVLLRNLDAPRPCNGIRLIVKNGMPHVIEATILTSCAQSEDVFVPRILIIPTDMPFEFKRLQFPVRLAFATSINKAQGPSLKAADINLASPCFSHGQVYVTYSRVGAGKNLYVLSTEGNTKNAVYEAALR
jgi:ATP-dependent DNA helicase PIF1